MITLTYENVMAILALFTATCVAFGWLLKIIKAARKPSDDARTKLDTNSKRIGRLEDDMEYLKNAMSVLLRSNIVMLGHMRTQNNTGEIAKQETEIQNFLVKR